MIWRDVACAEHPAEPSAPRLSEGIGQQAKGTVKDTQGPRRLSHLQQGAPAQTGPLVASCPLVAKRLPRLSLPCRNGWVWISQPHCQSFFVTVPLPAQFLFLLLMEPSSILRGWHPLPKPGVLP